ncbi:hypothetical protein [Chryseobacterium lacus]|uniref:hypothetical protein n=1 Tax=Chryseobacterium lacus TaxID=2058346 RepID=UPI000F8716B4|nr:hypothetical protein [Chryseobacterium lacus]RST27429.1 hypothetical protein EIZ46_03715 [Chryseobacterium lacus]
MEADPIIFDQTSRPQKAGKNTIVDPNADLKRYLEKAGLTEKVEKEFAKAPVSPGLYYLHTDHLGTATYVTNSAGDTSQFFLNLPFGEISAGDSPIPLKKINIREANHGGAEPAR